MARVIGDQVLFHTKGGRKVEDEKIGPKTSKWWPITSSKDTLKIQWCDDPRDNVRARLSDDKHWTYLYGPGVKAVYAYDTGVALIEKRCVQRGPHYLERVSKKKGLP